MTTVERLRAMAEPNSPWPELSNGDREAILALLEAGEEAEKALGASEHECPGPDNPNDCGDCFGVSARRIALTRLRSLGFGAKP